MCNENLYCNLISLHSACIPEGVVDFELDTAYVHYAHACVLHLCLLFSCSCPSYFE